MRSMMKWNKAKFTLSSGITFEIIHNMQPKSMVEAAFMNWIPRTDKYTAESLCDYINEKRRRGLTDHEAYTIDQFRFVNKDKL